MSALKNKAISGVPLPLVPVLLLAPLWFVSLALPNLVYSGLSWYDTLHIVKWAVAAIPVGIAALAAGGRMVFYGRERVDLKIDLFGTLWLTLLAYVTVQAVWVDISSRVGFIHELLCFSAVWAFYVISWNSFPDRMIRPLLWLANINAAVNVVFAELQIRGLNGFTRLILPTPGNYIGNTGQQNMFGLWMAICVMSSIYLYIAYATTPSGKKRHPAVTVLNLLLMTINIWGLLNSTSRSAMLSLLVSLAFLGSITLRQFGKDYVKRLGHVGGLFALVFIMSLVTNQARMTEMVAKTADMVQNVETIGGRHGIWATSRSMFKAHPFSGVGIGQYKWHYLKAQQEAFRRYPEQIWQYTHWAHNEFLQWFCEGGLIGGLILVTMWGVWGVFLIKMLWRREHVAREVIWACSLVALVSFNALWTRPFHRIENILWLSLAFAVSNRAMISVLAPNKSFSIGNLARVCGALFCVAGLGGLYYLAGGMVGDRIMREALSSQNAVVQRNLLQRASERLMVREDALKQLGYHYMRHGVQTQDLSALDRGFSILWQHFQREPHSEELGFLIEWSQRFQNIPILETLVSYLKPGTYRLGIEPHTDDSGNVIDAVVLIPLRSSGRQMFDPNDIRDDENYEIYGD
ncbi:MAG: O-antigen ligase family protein [Synergistaceae bacterium]|nr:O-antigen ligase family protein [Synergistaceae bacterium]